MSLKPLKSVKELEFKIEIKDSNYSFLEIKVVDLPQTIEVLTLSSYHKQTSLKNLKSLTTDSITKKNYNLLPSLQHLTVSESSEQSIAPQLKHLASLNIQIYRNTIISDLPFLSQLVVSSLESTLTLHDLPSLKKLQLGCQQIFL